jgi:hypothetical protein
MKSKTRVIGGAIVLLLLFSCCLEVVTSALAGAAFIGDKVPRMEASELLSRIDSPDIMIIDVRRNADWTGSEVIIRNAVRKAYNDVDSWVGELPKDKTFVLYCA